jgi:hypothetical protein
MIFVTTVPKSWFIPFDQDKMNLYFIGSSIVLVIMLGAGSWSARSLNKAYQIMKSQGVDLDMRIGWHELRRADARLYQQYALGLTIFGLSGVAGVCLLLFGWMKSQ